MGELVPWKSGYDVKRGSRFETAKKKARLVREK